jgi:hypothetical protein
MRENNIVDRICIYMCVRVCFFPRTVVASVKGLYPRCAGQLHSFEEGTVHIFFSKSK